MYSLDLQQLAVEQVIDLVAVVMSAVHIELAAEAAVEAAEAVVESAEAAEVGFGYLVYLVLA